MVVDYQVVMDASYNLEGKPRLNYSGRGMYGKTCLGFVYDNLSDLIEFAKEIPGLTKGDARMDSMGLSTIAYWPNVQVAMPKLYVLSAQPIDAEGRIGFPDGRDALESTAQSVGRVFADMAARIDACRDAFDAWDLSLSVRPDDIDED